MPNKPQPHTPANVRRHPSGRLHEPYDAARYVASHDALYHTQRWLKFRLHILDSRPLCEDCLAFGIIPPAPSLHVHHIRKVRDWPEGLCDDGNVMALCEACHNTRSAKGE